LSNRGWFRVHSFTGVVTGLMLFVICWSGTFAVLSHEIDWLVTPEARAEGGGTPARWGDLKAAVEDRFPEAEVQWLEAPLYPAAAAHAVVNLPAQDYVRVYVDPVTADVRGAYSYLDVQRFFRSFHYSLFLPEVGLYVVSVFSVTMLTSLVAALVFYRRWWRRFLHVPRGSGRVFWSALHKSAGLWSFWFLVAIGLTGVWYLFEAVRADFLDGKTAYAGAPDYAVYAIPAPATGGTEPLRLDVLVSRAKEVRPDLGIRSIYFDDGKVVFQGRAGHVLVRDRANQLHLDARTGEVLYDQTPHDYSLYWRWSDTADPLHFGDFGGLWSKGVWFVFGLALSGLILTGTWLHVQRLAREAGGAGRHRWPGTAAALVVTLAVLAASVPYGFIEARAFYGPAVDGVKELPTLAPGVRAVIIAWIAVTLAIIAAWVALLWRPGLIRSSVGAHRTREEAVTRA